jgi:flagellar hook-basal body complex protein FliE
VNVGRADINSLLSQMRDMKAASIPTSNIEPQQGIEKALNGRIDKTDSASPSFTSMFKGAINSVNETQQTSSSLKTSYERGDVGVSLTQVMVASQKASVSFDAMTQVRNKVVEAYKEVMNMPI